MLWGYVNIHLGKEFLKVNATDSLEYDKNDRTKSSIDDVGSRNENRCVAFHILCAELPDGTCLEFSDANRCCCTDFVNTEQT